mgnify:CR=1 FL=1
MKTSPFIPKGRFIFMLSAICLAFAAIAGRLFDLHVLERDKSIAAVDEQRQAIRGVNAKRGNIVDARGNLLASSRPVIDLAMDPEVIEELREKDPDLYEKNRQKMEEAAKILNIPPSVIFDKCRPERRIVETDGGTRIRSNRFRRLMRVEEDVFERLQALSIKGLTYEKNYVRTYPSEGLASHAIGFINNEGTPVCGVERMCNYYLRGQDGWIQTEKDARNREIAQFRTREVAAENGMNVELTIDIILQEMAQRELQAVVEKYSPENASIIVGDPATGYILAMASYPSFNPNTFSKSSDAERRNYAISNMVEPGSTFKIIPIAAALNEHMVTQDDVFDTSESTALYKGRTLRLPRDTHDYGQLSVRQIAEKSSNRGAAHLGMMLGEKKLYEYAKLFGYGEKTGLGLAGEENGLLHNPRSWDGLTITRLPMGHAVSATPLQIHCATSVIANQGVYMKPQLVRRVFSGEDGREIVFAPKRVRQVVSPKTAATMCDILTGVVGKDGTAQRAAVEGYKVAGKTGTTQKIVEIGRKTVVRDGREEVRIIKGYTSKQHVASFTGFFPANRPRLVITVVIDSPKGSGYGGVVAAPAFAHIARQAASYLGIQTDEEFEKIVAWKGMK